jgi:hypothetical protein
LTATSGNVVVASAGTANFGSLTLTGAGSFTVYEDSDTLFSGSSSVGTASLTSSGSIQNASGTALTISGLAVLQGSSIDLGTQTGDQINSGTLTLIASGSVRLVETSSSELVGNNSGSSFSVTSETGSSTLTGNISTSSGSVVLEAGQSVIFGSASAVTSAGGSVTISADYDSSGTAGSGGVAMADGASITAGSGTVSVAATDNITIGNIQSSTLIRLTTSQGSILDGGDSEVDLVGTSVVLRTKSGIGSVNPLDTQITSLAYVNTSSGDVKVNNQGGLTITAIDGASTSSNSGNTVLTATSPITFAVTSTQASVTLQATESGATNYDNINLAPGVQVIATTGNVVFEAGDRIIIQSGALVKAALGEVIFRSGLNDSDNDGSMTLDGTIQAETAGQAVTLDLNQEQGATQNTSTGAILATNLRLISTGTNAATFTLMAGTRNDVDTLAISTSGAVSYSDADDLIIGSIAASSGIVAMAGISTLNGVTEGAAVAITANNGMTVNQNIRTSPVAGPGSLNLGTVTLTSTVSTISITDNGDIYADGVVSLTAGGGIQTAGEVTTSSDNITYNSAVTLTGAVDLTTGSNAGNITFNSTVDGSEDLTLTAGTGNIDFNQSVGQTTRLDQLRIISVTAATFDAAVSAQNFLQNAGSDTTTFTGRLNTNTASGINVTGTSLVFNGGITTTTAGPVTASLSSTALIGPSTTSSISGPVTINTIGSITVASSASVAVSNTVLLKTTADSITFQNSAQITGTSGNIVLEAEDNISLAGGSTIAVTGGELILRSGLSSTDGVGSMTLDGTLQAVTAGQSITLDLNDELAATQNTTTGRILAPNLRLLSNGTNAATFTLLAGTRNDVDTLAINTSGAVSYSDADDLIIGSIAASSGIAAMAGISTLNGVTEGAAVAITANNAMTVNQNIRTSPVAGPGSLNLGTVTLTSTVSTISITDNGDIYADGVVSLTAGGGIQTAGEVTTSSDNITWNSAVTLTAPSISPPAAVLEISPSMAPSTAAKT